MLCKKAKFMYNKIRYMSLTLAFCLVACNYYFDSALDQAGSNIEEKVLEHFKDDPDTLKYSAAVFLIENMPYHYTQDGKGLYSVDSASCFISGDATPMKKYYVILGQVSYNTLQSIT